MSPYKYQKLDVVNAQEEPIPTDVNSKHEADRGGHDSHDYSRIVWFRRPSVGFEA